MNKLNDLKNEHILVLGLAKSGTASAKLLLKNDIKTRVNDYGAKETDDDVIELKNLGADVIVGSHPSTVLDDITLIVKNPGIPYDIPIVKEALEQEIPIISEIELASLLIPNDQIIGLSGSNGKTTTTTLIGDMLKQSKKGVKIAGNIGVVATEMAESLTEEEILLLELSSFQLQGIQTFKPKIAALLNIFDAHLDYHKTKQNYIDAKCNIFTNQTEQDFLVYNADDQILTDVVKHAKGTLIPFSLTQQRIPGAWIDETTIYFKDEQIMLLEDVALVGDHNIANILAAISVAKLSGATNESIIQTLKTFTGVKHRLQFVTELNGRFFYNDSKATNMLATEKALRSFKQPVILLAGGLDRGDDYTELVPYLDYVKSFVLFGETAKKLEKVAHEIGIMDTVIVKDVKEAVKAAYERSAEKDVILLSPACASWDQYGTFEERGDMFIDAVHKLA